jgi:pimeloyl-ACP methyl ester carboxylesterase
MSFVAPFEVSGGMAASPLLLIAPLARDRTSWSMQLPAFTAEFRCITYDARGTGNGAKPVETTSVAEMAQDALTLLTELELQQVHVAGWSMGAAVATALAIDEPQRVRSLSLYTPWGRTDRWLSLGFEALADILRDGTLADYEAAITWLLLSREMINSIDNFDAFIKSSVASPGYPEPATIAAHLEASRRHDLLDEASAISCPTLVIAGEGDRLVPAVYARELAASIPTSRLQVVEGVGSTHGLLVERAAEFNELALSFIREVDDDL